MARNLQPVFQFSGAKMGCNPQDKFMMALGNTLVVVTQYGDVFGADVVEWGIGLMCKSFSAVFLMVKVKGDQA